MPSYSKLSKARLATCHDDLITIFNKVIEHMDVTIVCGHRGKEEQNEAYDSGYSQVKYPNSKHNKKPSMAVDVVPYPEMWTDMDKLQVLGGFVLGIAAMLYEEGEIEHLVRWGHDWDMDWDLDDSTFIDAPHFELFKPILDGQRQPV